MDKNKMLPLIIFKQVCSKKNKTKTKTWLFRIKNTKGLEYGLE